MMHSVFSSWYNTEGRKDPCPSILSSALLVEFHRLDIQTSNVNFCHVWMSVFSISIDRFHCVPLEFDAS